MIDIVAINVDITKVRYNLVVPKGYPSIVCTMNYLQFSPMGQKLTNKGNAETRKKEVCKKIFLPSFCLEILFFKIKGLSFKVRFILCANVRNNIY